MMSVVWNPSAVSAAEPSHARVTVRTLAPFVVFAAVIFNFVLCFVNTKLFSVNTNVVISCEIVLTATAFGLIWNRGGVLYVILCFLATYFFAVMLIRSNFDPKIVRDLLIPFVFFFMGSYLGSLRSSDRLVTLLIVLSLGTSLLECLALDTYLHYFNVIEYYVARGSENLQSDTAAGLLIKGTDTTAGLFINATRFSERTLLSFLGSHRVSGIFLEPVSVGNFGAIAFAWVLLRDRSRVWILIAKLLAILTILVLADARFGFYLCIFTLAIYLAAPIVRPTMLFLAPFLVMILLSIYAGNGQETTGNTIAGRLVGGGESLMNLDPWRIFGLQESDVFAGGYAGDSGYGYLLVKIGLLGLAAIWALFAYAPVPDRDAWRFKNFITWYSVFLLCISASLFTIKTAALLWFLYGTLNNNERYKIVSALRPRSPDPLGRIDRADLTGSVNLPPMSTTVD
jgi:putative polymerase